MFLYIYIVTFKLHFLFIYLVIPFIVIPAKPNFDVPRCTIHVTHTLRHTCTYYKCLPEDKPSGSKHVKIKVIPQQAELAQGIPDRLRPPIFLTFGTTRVVGLQPNAPAAFTPGEIPGTHFQKLTRPQGTWFCRGYHRKKSPVTPPGIDPGTVRLVAP
jgi:hypothetical protein